MVYRSSAASEQVPDPSCWPASAGASSTRRRSRPAASTRRPRAADRRYDRLACSMLARRSGTTGSACRPRRSARSLTRGRARRRVPAQGRVDPQYPQAATGSARDRRPVDWELAERVAVRVAGREPFAESYHYDSLAARLRRAHRRGRGAGRRGHRPALASPGRPGPGSPTAPAGSAPTSPRSSGCCGRSPTRLGERMAASAARRRSPAQVAGAEVGQLLGWMSTRVLGQYDLLVIEDEDPDDQDLVYYVGPNVLALEKRFALPAPRVPAVAGAPRGHPPGPVHRRAVAARALPRPRRADARRRRPRSEAVPRRRSAGSSTTCAPASNPLDDGGLVDAARQPRAARACSTRSAG